MASTIEVRFLLIWPEILVWPQQCGHLVGDLGLNSSENACCADVFQLVQSAKV